MLILFPCSQQLQLKQGECFWWKEKKPCLFGFLVLLSYLLPQLLFSSFFILYLSEFVSCYLAYVLGTNNFFLVEPILIFTVLCTITILKSFLTLLASLKPGTGGNSSLSFELPWSPVIVLEQLHTLGPPVNCYSDVDGQIDSFLKMAQITLVLESHYLWHCACVSGWRAAWIYWWRNGWMEIEA